MKREKLKIIVLVIVVFGFFLSVFPVGSCSAQIIQNVTINPNIIDEKASPRDILEKSIKIKNNSASGVELYVFVNDIKKDEGKQEFIDPKALDKAASLARWIEISRAAIQLKAGEEQTIPLKITVNLSALPGKYYAAITFARGSNRTEAENAIIQGNQAQLMINMEVKDNTVERAESGFFRTEKNINLNGQVNFLFSIKNIGNKDITPKGSVLIYAQNGALLDTLDINKEANNILPQENLPFRITWRNEDRVGKFKAKLNAEYGGLQGRELQDVTSFWMLPFWLMASIIGLVLMLFVSLIVLLFRLMQSNKLMYLAENDERDPIIDLKNR
jgi:hypothetical protein